MTILDNHATGVGRPRRHAGQIFNALRDLDSAVESGLSREESLATETVGATHEEGTRP